MEGVSAAVADMSRVLGRACRARVRPKPRLDRRKTPLRTRSPRGCASIRRTGPLEPTTRSWARRQPILWRPGSIVVRATCTDVQSRSFARGARFRLATSRACGLATPRAFSRSFESAFFPSRAISRAIAHGARARGQRVSAGTLAREGEPSARRGRPVSPFRRAALSRARVE